MATEKATVLQTSQIGLETVMGTAVPANKKLQAVELTIKPRNESEANRPLGYKYPTGVQQNKEWAEVGIGGKPAFQDLVYIFSSLLHYAAPTQQGSTAAYKWKFVSNTFAEDVGKSFTIEQGDSEGGMRTAGVKIGSISMTFRQSGISLDGTGYGDAVEANIVKTSNPTEINSTLISPNMLEFYMADTQAGLASAQKFCRSFSLDWGLTDKFSLAYPIGCEPFNVESAPINDAKLTIATNATGMEMVSLLRDGTTKWFRIKAVGPVIADSYSHTFQLDFPAKIAKYGDPKDEQKVWAIDYALQPVHDATWGKALDVEIITDISTL